MKTIGLIGGMSWQSSAQYYRLINDRTHDRLGGQQNAPSVMVTLNFAEVEPLMVAGEWDAVGLLVAEAAVKLDRAGADLVILCTNTIHKVCDSIVQATPLPFLHIVDATAAAIGAAGHRKVGLLGTRFTMEQDFFRARLLENHGIEALIPNPPARSEIHRIIFDELCLGRIRPESRAIYLEIIEELVAEGAESVILGCTEIGMLIKPEDTPVPLWDTTLLHAYAAVDFALAE